jgi:2'-5' RNA ligase
MLVGAAVPVRSLAVVAYPTLSDGDRSWVEGIRTRYDPLAPRIAAHFTLVFPTEVAEAPLVAQVRNALQSASPIPVVLRRAAVYPDAIGGGGYIFLVAEEGYRELVTLHDALYEGVLAAHKRPDIPFVPHVTVGGQPQVGECERIANELNGEDRIVRAWINSVDVIELGESMMRTVAEIPLGSRGNQPPNPTVQRTGGSRCSPSSR